MAARGGRAADDGASDRFAKRLVGGREQASHSRLSECPQRPDLLRSNRLGVSRFAKVL